MSTAVPRRNRRLHVGVDSVGNNCSVHLVEAKTTCALRLRCANLTPTSCVPQCGVDGATSRGRYFGDRYHILGNHHVCCCTVSSPLTSDPSGTECECMCAERASVVEGVKPVVMTNDPAKIAVVSGENKRPEDS